jgi:hypothetical protein
VNRRAVFLKAMGRDVMPWLSSRNGPIPLIEPYGNVLTDIMLPLAAHLSNHVTLYGCDGRPPAQAGSFPKHGALASLDRVFEAQINATRTCDPYDAEVAKFYRATRYAVSACKRRGAQLFLRVPSYNYGLADLPLANLSGPC